MMFKTLFPDEILSAIRRMAPPPTAADALYHGRHRSPRGGGAEEFQDHRAYRGGDDLRRIDWNVYRRSGKLFLRSYRRSPERRHWLILDGSGSIRCADARRDCAWRTAALLGGTLLANGDPLTLKIGAFRRDFPAGSAAASALLKVLYEHAATPPSPPDFAHPEGGSCFVVSDFLDPAGLDALERKLRGVPGFTPIRICDQWELDPVLDREYRLIDAESGESVTVHPRSRVIERYRENLRRLEELLAHTAARGGARTHVFVTDAAVGELIGQVAAEFAMEAL